MCIRDRAIVAANIIVFLILSIMGDTQDAWFMVNHGACYAPFVIEYQEYYRLFTCMFLHFGVEHLFYNMLLLIFLGDTLEKTVGKLRYLIIYQMCIRDRPEGGAGRFPDICLNTATLYVGKIKGEADILLDSPTVSLSLIHI